MSSYPTEVDAQAAAVARVEVAALRRELVTRQLHGDPAFAFIVDRMSDLTGAAGAAIALSEGAHMVCRASVGNAPSVGARINPDSGLSGECLRTGALVRCRDSETDSRADRSICRSLQIRSILIVPLPHQGRPEGVLEVFSSEPNAFQPGDELALVQIAELVAETAGLQPKPAATISNQRDTPPVLLEEVATELKTTKAPPAADEARIATKQPAPPALSLIRITEVEPAVAVKAPKPSAVILQLPVRTEKPAPETPAETPLLTTLLPTAKIRAIAAGTLLLLVSAGLWLGSRAGNSAERDAGATKPKPVTATLALAPVAAEPAPRRAIETVTVKASEAPNEPPTKKEPRTIIMARPNVISPPPAIVLAARPDEASPISGLLNAPVAAPRLDAPKISQTSGGKLLKRVDPIYPRSIAQNASGEVVLKVTVNRKGEVSRVTLVRGPAVLAQAAIAAVSRWRYEPFLLNGEPIEVESDVVVNFKAPGK
jgi:TonB family protein